MSERGANSRADIDPVHLAALSEGHLPSRTLTETLAIDQSTLLRAVSPVAAVGMRSVLLEAESLGILKRMQRIGAGLARELDYAETNRLATHPSDTVRGWICFMIASTEYDGPAALLAKLRPFADDPHFAVREWVWMAARPQLVLDLDASIAQLAGWTGDASERIRRFASEALRPRGVWASHISAFKTNPDRGLPILEPLRADPSPYVQDSVANWINDAAKTNPDWARALTHRWLADGKTDAATVRIARRALRSL